MAAASMASCIGVTWSSSWPIAESARREGSGSLGYVLADTGSGIGSFSAGGAKTADCRLRLAFPDSHVELVTTLNEEPGGNVSLIALLSSGWRGSCRYCLSILSSRVPLSVAYRLGLKLG